MERVANTAPLCVWRLHEAPLSALCCVNGLLFVCFWHFSLTHRYVFLVVIVYSVLCKQAPFVGVQLISPSLGQGADVLSRELSLLFALDIIEHVVCAIPAR